MWNVGMWRFRRLVHIDLVCLLTASLEEHDKNFLNSINYETHNKTHSYIHTGHMHTHIQDIQTDTHPYRKPPQKIYPIHFS
jgi:hypothetical protein